METINRAFAELTAARNANAEALPAWSQFCEVIAARLASNAPSHYRVLLELAADIGDRGTLRILDHGCGSGRTVLILRALGYPRAEGIDLNDHVGAKWNAWLPAVAIGTAAPFQAYEGRRLPFADATFDLVFSQQVVEHLPPDVFETYFREEGRVLKPGGRAATIRCRTACHRSILIRTPGSFTGCRGPCSVAFIPRSDARWNG